MLRSTLAAALLFTFAARADDWPQWMGKNRDDRWSETGILRKFPAGGPKKLWSHPIAEGYAGPAVVGDRVYVLDYMAVEGPRVNDPNAPIKRTGKERVVCLEAGSGKELWVHAHDCEYHISYPGGPRCTPTVADGKVYALGAMGNLVVLDADKGTQVWSKDFKTDYRAKPPMWGFAGHPLVYRNLVVCVVGGEHVLVAFDKETGNEIWKAITPPSEGPGYCAPTLIDAGGVKQLVVWDGKKIVSLNPDTGKKYWDVPLEAQYGMAIMGPRQAGDYLFAGGIGFHCVVLKLDRSKPAVEEVWRGKKETGIYPVNSTPIIEDGVIYGVDQPGILRGVKLDTGERLWWTSTPITGKPDEREEKRINSGTAFLTKNGDRYFLFSETGDLIIARLSPKGYEEIDRAKLLDPTNEAFRRPVLWSHPAYANKCVFVRNDKEIVCYSLAE
jgi:outer membrane protein assembly factor BamB